MELSAFQGKEEEDTHVSVLKVGLALDVDQEETHVIQILANIEEDAAGLLIKDLSVLVEEIGVEGFVIVKKFLV